MRLFREPLFHFFLMGLAIFAWYDWLNPSEPGAGDPDLIVIERGDLERVAQQFQATWRRPPQPAELQGLLDSLVREEMLVREAQALGLDRGDGIIRNRLAQKMEFLTTSVAQAMQPDDTVLKAHLDARPDRFARAGQVAFEQVALPQDADAAAALAALRAGADPAGIGKPTLLPQAMPLAVSQSVDGTFGQGFFAALSQLPEGQWAGPVQSGYGLHLVRVTGRVDAEVPPSEMIREEVLLDWRRDRAGDLTEAQLDQLKTRYRIVTPSPEDLAAWTAQ